MKQLIDEEEKMTFLNPKVTADQVQVRFLLNSFYFFLVIVDVFNQIYVHDVVDVTAPPCGHSVSLPSWFGAHEGKKKWLKWK